MSVAAQFPFFKSISIVLRASGLIFEGLKKLFACRNDTFCMTFTGVIPQKSDHGNGLVEFLFGYALSERHLDRYHRSGGYSIRFLWFCPVRPMSQKEIPLYIAVASDLRVWETKLLAECIVVPSNIHFKTLKSEVTSSKDNRYGPDRIELEESLHLFQEAKLLL